MPLRNIFLKRNIQPPRNNSTLRYVLKRNENICQKKVCKNVHGSIIHYNQKVGTVQMSVPDEQINEM